MLLASILAVVVTGEFRRLPPELRHHLHPSGAVEAVASKRMGGRKKVPSRVFALFLPVPLRPQVVLVFLARLLVLFIGFVLQKAQCGSRPNAGLVVFASPDVRAVLTQLVLPGHAGQVMAS